MIFFRFRFLFYSFGLLLLLISYNKCLAQNSSVEFWPESDIWYRLNPSWRLSSYIAITKYNEGKTRDLNITLQADYAWGHAKNPFFGRLRDEKKAATMKTWLLRGGYMGGQSLYDHGEKYTENMVLTEIHKRIPLKGKGLLSMRFRNDLRWLNSSDDFSYRFRYRLMFEKEYEAGKSSVVPYVNVEPFWDSRYSIVNRFRLIGGATVARGKLLALEGNFTYQYDSKSSVENVYALNVILHVFFERKKIDVKASGSEQP